MNLQLDVILFPLAYSASGLIPVTTWEGRQMFFFFFFLTYFIDLFIFKNLFILFIFGCVGSVAACGLSLVAASGGYSSLQCVGFSLQWLLLLLSMGSRCTGFSSCGSRALEHRLSSSGAWA